MVAYFNLSEIPSENRLFPRMSAARVIAAGSVMNDPSSGTTARTTKCTPTLPGRGIRLASLLTAAIAVCRMGLVPAMTMITKTNMGSVKLRVST